MARDAGLEELLREALESTRGVTETTMFGGRAFMVRGNLACCARHDGLLFRLSKGNEDWALALPDVAPMWSGTRRMHGWVRALPAAYGDDCLRARLVAAALAFVGTLPDK